MSKVSVIGLGAMGLPMAKCLVKAGFEVTGFDLNAKALDELESAGGRVASSAAAAAQASDIVLLMVVNADQAEAVLFADGGLNGLTQGQTVIASCTMAPDRAKAMGEKLAGYSVGLLDAPVSGGTTGAASGTLAIMAAGPQAVFEHGQGSAVKLVNQLLCGVHIAAAAEAMALGARAGIDPKVIYEVIGNAAGSSWMFKDRVPRMMEGSPEVKSAVDIFVKDLGIVLDFGHGSRFPLPLSAVAHQLFVAASGAGLGRADDSQVRQVYDMMTGTGPKAS
jgi:3-hydroxyisobutyrate dehydrogenase